MHSNFFLIWLSCHFRFLNFIELLSHNIRFVMPRNLLLVTITKGEQKNNRFATCCTLLSTAAQLFPPQDGTLFKC